VEKEARRIPVPAVESLIFLFAASTAGSAAPSFASWASFEEFNRADGFILEELWADGGGDRVFNADLNVNFGRGAKEARTVWSFSESAFTACS